VIWSYWITDTADGPIYRTDQPNASATVYEARDPQGNWEIMPAPNIVSDYLSGKGDVALLYLWRCYLDLGTGHVLGVRTDGTIFCATCHPSSVGPIEYGFPPH
jgi:hypothetical protein